MFIDVHHVSVKGDTCYLWKIVFVLVTISRSNILFQKMRFAVENHCRTLKAKAELQIKHKDPRKEDLKLFQKI